MAEICRNFMRFNCSHGANCKYLHPIDLCPHFWNHGKCKYNDNCKKTHTHKPTQEKPTQEKQVIREVQKKHDHVKTSRPIISGKNTENWNPIYSPLDARILIDTSVKKLSVGLTSRDILLVPNLFLDYKQGEICNRLINEIKTLEAQQDSKKDLIIKWHGHTHNNQPFKEGTHDIVNSRVKKWEESCPTFNLVLERIRTFFNMDIKAHRFNIYNSTKEWKPFHHDSSYLSQERANQQNFTIALNFTQDGHLRSAAFEHAKTYTRLEFPLKDGDCYCFGNDTNVIFRHGILPEKTETKTTRVSVIAWGWVNGVETVTANSVM